MTNLLTSQSERKRELKQRLVTVRDRTLWMLDQVPDEYLRVRVHSFYSPIGWHFGHVGRTEEYWVCQALGREPFDARLSFLYADLPDNPKDNRVHIPDRVGVIEYLRETRKAVLDALEGADLDSDEAILTDGYAWEFAIQHECQHQETIAEMLQLIQKQSGQPELATFKTWRSARETEWVEIPSGEFEMGSADRHGYDNEKDPHIVKVAPFRLAKNQVTAFEWSQFIDAGGYRNKSLWTDEGWEWKQREQAELPEYWVIQNGRYASFGPFGLRAVDPDEPAASLSWHEASAYAKWRGKRLPTEQEWEYVATSAGAVGDVPRRYPWGFEEPSDSSACFGLTHWGVEPVGMRPEGDSATGIQDLAGNVWEWTSSPFLPYPGFSAYPYDGYSKDHMLGKHFVCRGGSWATSPQILRCSFRNWYVPTYRQGFLGMRLADDAC